MYDFSHKEVRRRAAQGLSLRNCDPSAIAMGQAELEACERHLAPLTSRIGDVVSALLEMTAAPSTPGTPEEMPPSGSEASAAGELPAAIIGAHSRLLRELLFVFRSSLFHAQVR